MKRFSFVLIILAMMFTSICFAAPASVQLNGNLIDFTDSEGNKVEAQILSNRTMVPLRKIFEELGCTVEWDGATRTATAKKDDVTLVLQIDNRNVKKIVDGQETKMGLDVAPTIYNNRTLVPLRFIAESLDKQVGWDAKKKTAIIIDYDYFAESLENKAKYLYNILGNDYENFDITITRKYFDEVNAKKNTTSTINANVDKNGDFHNLNISFSGDSDLMNEIREEGWSGIDLKVKYKAGGMIFSTTNKTLAKMLGVAPDSQSTINYDSVKLVGNVEDSLANAIRNIVGIQNNELNINSFAEINNEWNRILSNMTYTNSKGKATFKLNNIQNLDLKYFDFAKLDNIIYGNAVNKTYNFVNKKIFNYDVKLDELMYDMSDISLNGTMTNDGKKANITFTATNDYREKIVYDVAVSVR